MTKKISAAKLNAETKLTAFIEALIISSVITQESIVEGTVILIGTKGKQVALYNLRGEIITNAEPKPKWGWSSLLSYIPGNLYVIFQEILESMKPELRLIKDLKISFKAEDYKNKRDVLESFLNNYGYSLSSKIFRIETETEFIVYSKECNSTIANSVEEACLKVKKLVHEREKHNTNPRHINNIEIKEVFIEKESLLNG